MAKVKLPTGECIDNRRRLRPNGLVIPIGLVGVLVATVLSYGESKSKDISENRKTSMENSKAVVGIQTTVDGIKEDVTEIKTEQRVIATDIRQILIRLGEN